MPVTTSYQGTALEEYEKDVLNSLGFDNCSHWPRHAIRGYRDGALGELRKDGECIVLALFNGRYWVVECKVPPEVAVALDAYRLHIRTYGYAGGIDPLQQRPDGTYMWMHLDNSGNWYVPSYHIDLDEYFAKFVEILREHKVVD